MQSKYEKKERNITFANRNATHQVKQKKKLYVQLIKFWILEKFKNDREIERERENINAIRYNCELQFVGECFFYYGIDVQVFYLLYF